MRFEKGNTYGKGRPKGSQNFSTIFKRAIRKIAKEKLIDQKDIEIQMVIKAISEALKGRYSFYKDTMDRVYGTPKESVDMNIETNRIAVVIHDVKRPEKLPPVSEHIK